MRISRRHMLGAFGAIALVSCGGSGSSGSTTTSSTAGGSTGSGSLSCVVTPSATEGPYFVDENLNRSDLTSDTTDPNVLTALPLALQIAAYRVSSGACAPLAGAQVDVWHADAGGVYSDIAAQSTVGQTFLRGYQLTDASGAANFTTIYPGWYPGRTAHIHFKVRSGNFEFTSQWFMDDNITDSVYSAPPYSTRGARNTRNDSDGIYNSTLLLPLARQRNVGYIGTYFAWIVLLSRTRVRPASASIGRTCALRRTGRLLVPLRLSGCVRRRRLRASAVRANTRDSGIFPSALSAASASARARRAVYSSPPVASIASVM